MTFIPANPDFEARTRASFARQGAMALIGAALERVEPGLVQVGLGYRPDLSQQHGFFHAGLISTIAHVAGGYAGFTLFPRDPARPEWVPPAGGGPREAELRRRLAGEPRAVVSTTLVESLEDPDARENWTQFLRFRDRVLAHPTLEACYLDLFRANQVDIAPVFV